MKHRAKMGLEELTRGTTQLLSTSKTSRRKMAAEGRKKMAADREKREAKRLKNMDRKDDLEECGGVLLPK